MNNGKKPNKTHPFEKKFKRRDLILYTGLAMTTFAIPGISGCVSSYPKKNCVSPPLPYPETEKPSKEIFGHGNLGGIQVKNRIVRSATTLSSPGEYGLITERLLEHYKELCEGGVGMIITGMGDNGLLIDHPTFGNIDLKEHEKVSSLAHQYNTAVIQQISHRGSQIGLKSNEKEFSLNRLTELEIQSIIDQCVHAIECSRDADFDGIQLHAAHGYLLSEFLSPDMNRRRDKWGGSTENRFRVIREIIGKARKNTGDFPIHIKINAYDFQKNGMTVEEAVKIAVLLQNAGCDAIEVSSGTGKDGFSTIRVPEIPMKAILELTSYGEKIPGFLKGIIPAFSSLAVDRYEPLNNYNVCASKELKNNLDIPVIVVGGIREVSDIQHILDDDAADFVAMSRPFIIEPDIVNRFKRKQTRSSECISCGYCIVATESGPAECYYGEI